MLAIFACKILPSPTHLDTLQGLTILVLLTMLFPMTDRLSRVSQAMCHGDVSFVWTMDKRGLTLLSSTNSSGAQAGTKSFHRSDNIDVD